ncbi:hypothetical protein BRAS3843_1730012 [Bradyrhizobium sp. STM 3843]|uniref:hypothetical protein n=1 Tax=Bradyrhizobium sp. STM 3843 TaxID=551947 RepID=UPI000240711D|nr:hypothetical protein [Bradyrhizobium sp. STM 3843]CCE06443.1 hypothetical protein BRAS3843_1730012 [Bradyrhizobium sp. STM 3843]
MDGEVVLPPTVSLLVYAKAALDLGEVAAYAAAAEKRIPTIRVGKFIRVAPRVALAQLAGGDPETLRLLTRDFAAKLKALDANKAA